MVECSLKDFALKRWALPIRSDSGNTSRDTSIDDHLQKRQIKRDPGFHMVPDQVCSFCSPSPSPSWFFHYHTSIGSAEFRWHLAPVAVTTFTHVLPSTHLDNMALNIEAIARRHEPAELIWTAGANMNVGPCWCQNQLERATEYPHVHAHLNSFTSSNSCFFLMIWMLLSDYHQKQSSSLLHKSTQKLRKTWNCQHSSLQHALGRHARRDPATARLGMVLRLVCLLFPWQSERLMQC